MDLSLLAGAPFLLLRLMHNDGLSRDKLIRLQNKKLRKIVKHSFEKVPYYNKLFRASGIRPEDIRTADDLNKIPISKKTDLSDLELKEITASNMNSGKNRLVRTSGTSGINLKFYHEYEYFLTTLFHIYLWQLRVGDKVNNRHLNIGATWILPTPFEKMGIFPTKRVSPLAGTAMQIKEIMEYEPNFMVALPSTIRLIANEIIDQKINVKIPIICGGGEMLDMHTRRLAKEAFDAEVFDGYGMTEVGGICAECRLHRGQHIFGDQVIVEITRDGEKVSPGEKGNIIVTSLSSYSTPFLRYSTGDIGMLIDDECTCGSQHPLMSITEGRMSDTIVLKDGRLIPAHEVCVSLYPVQGIKQFQVIQESANSFTVKVVKKSRFIKELHENIVRSVEQKIGKVDVEVLITDDIPKLRSGKFKQFISKVH